MAVVDGRDGVEVPEAFVEEYLQFGRWGEMGGHLGSHAEKMGLALAESKPALAGGEAPYWDRNDHYALNRLKDIDYLAGLLRPVPEPIVDPREISDLLREVQRLHTALPFDEAERFWLIGDLAVNRTDESITGEAVEVMAGGVHRVIQGRELVRKWCDWRRETGEFAFQGGLDEAREALEAIGDTLKVGACVIPDDDPEAYAFVR